MASTVPSALAVRGWWCCRVVRWACDMHDASVSGAAATIVCEDALRQAIGLHQAGRLDEAESRYRDILHHWPDHPDACHNLGILLAQTNRQEQALNLLGMAVSAAPTQLQFWLSHAQMLRAVGDVAGGEALFARAQQQGLAAAELAQIAAVLRRYAAAVMIPETQKNTLLGLLGSGQFSQAEELARGWTQSCPQDGFGWKVRGIALHLLGRHAEAAQAMQEAVRLQPDDAEAHNALAVILLGLGRATEAEACSRAALALDPDNAEAHYNLGNGLRQLDRLEAAAESYRRALELKPGLEQAHCNLGWVLRDLGHIDEAIASYERALVLNPDDANCHRGLGELKPFVHDDPRLPQLRALYRTVTHPTERAHACFALARASDEIGEFDTAFGLYVEGNRLLRQQSGYVLDEDRALFAAIRAAFTPLPVAQPLVAGQPQAILVVGMPRSGTSLVEQILASHPDVYGAGELEVLNTLVEQYFLAARSAPLLQVSQEIGSGYQAALQQIAPGRVCVTDKMPHNFRWLGLLLLTNPDVRVVHLMRDPVATCWSLFKQFFPQRALGFACDLADLAEYYRMYRQLMAFWHECFPGRIFDLDYERLTEHQDAETRRLLDFCGLSWNDRCLSFEQTQRPVRTASATQVRRGMYQGSSQAWRNYERHMGVLLDGLGEYAAG